MNSIKDTTSYILARTAHRHRQNAHQKLTAVGLHVGQEIFLSYLWEQDGLTQTELAERGCIQPATVTRIIQRLEEAGHVERRKDAHDQRIWRVYLTTSGRVLEDHVKSVWQEIEAQVTKGLLAEERLLLRRLLLHIFHNLEPVAPDVDL